MVPNTYGDDAVCRRQPNDDKTLYQRQQLHSHDEVITKVAWLAARYQYVAADMGWIVLALCMYIGIMLKKPA